MPKHKASPGYRWAREHVLKSSAATAAWMFQVKLEESQWYSANQHLAYQTKRLGELLRHAKTNVPFYATAYKSADIDVSRDPDPATWRRIPLLTRAALQGNKAALTAARVPPDHGKSIAVASSGSTGTPVEALATELTGTWNRALTLRAQLWALKRFDYRLAVIRRYPNKVADYPAGRSLPAWENEITLPVVSGPVFSLAATTPTTEQVEWLNRHRPEVLLTYPSIFAGLLDAAASGELKLPGLRRILTISEMLADEVRVAARRTLGVEIFDAYSANETGSIALQCPEGHGYHVQSEALVVEVLHDDGRPCGPGETGRVVVTLLHNYALPLIRYEIGDFATVGRQCRCGRGLPVLTRIIGRQRNMLIGPKGERSRPALGWKYIKGMAPITQGQFIQHTIEKLEAKLVVARPLVEAEEARVRELLTSRMPQFSEVVFTYVEELPRSEGGKFEDFISLVGKPSPTADKGAARS